MERSRNRRRQPLAGALAAAVSATLLLMSGVASAQPCTNAFRSACLSGETLGSCYQVDTTPRTRSEANGVAQATNFGSGGGYLATVTSAAERDLLEVDRVHRSLHL